MTRDETGFGDEVGGLDRVRAETQVRNRLRAGFVRVVDEIALCAETGVLGDDLDGVLVGADRAVRTEAIEDGAGDVGALDRERRVDGQTGVRNVVIDPDGEPGSRGAASVAVRLRELVECRFHHRGCEVLGRDAVAPTDDTRQGRSRAATERVGGGRDDVEIQRLAGRPRLLGLLEDGNGGDRGRKSGQEMGRRKWTIQTNLQHPDLFATRGEHLHRLACGLRPGAHQDQHTFGVGRASYSKARSGVPSGREPLHGVGDDARHGGVKRAHASRA